MDVDALAREIADRLFRAEVAVPPFPAYYPRWARRIDARAHAAGLPARTGEEPEHRAVSSVTRVDIGRTEDLDSYLYRVEPGAVALLLVIRGESLAYLASAGGWFDRPDEMRGGSFPPFDLASMAIWARAEGELGLAPGGQTSLRDGGPVHVAFAIERSRYEALDEGARAALHDACIPIARDSALLISGRSGPLTIAFSETDTREETATGTRRPGPERLIAEFMVP